MATTVDGAFAEFYQAINLSGDHRATANSRREHLVGLLGRRFTIVEAFASGSIPRFTALRRYSDVDVVVALHFGKHVENRTPAQVLQDVRDALAEYRTNVRKNGQAVTLYYSSWPDVDVVPAARYVDSGGTVTHYIIPDMNKGTWIQARPRQHSDNVENRSTSCGPYFRQIIKMIKIWNRNHSGYLQSYHIEAMAVQTFRLPLDDLPWQVFQYFDSAATLANNPMWYEGGVADSYLDYFSRLEAVRRLESARDLARAAWSATYRRHDHEQAIRKWRQLFGEPFPAYG